MAKAESVITIKSEVRPCVIRPHMHRALWHGWAKDGNRRNGLDVVALVEYEGGIVDTMDAGRIMFTDSRGRFEEYIWPEGCAHDGD